MGLFSRLEHIIFGEKMPEKPVMKITMMGARGVGKTSVLTSMYSNMNEAISEKVMELENYFTDPVYIDSQVFRPDQTSTDNPRYFQHEVRIGDRESGYTLKFTDIPGEYYASPQYNEVVRNMVNKSQVMLIAIDTPHMMEKIDEATGIGEGHYVFNRVREITHYFKEAFKENKEPRLVIFVPLKCEKYYYKNKMDKVSQMVKTSYKPLLDILGAEGNRDLCTVAIMPILTLGGAEFFRFDSDLRDVGIYNYVRNIEKRKYAPQFCEQPLILILRFLVAVAKKAKNKQWAIVRLFKETFRNAARMNDLLKCKQTLTELLKTDGDGYVILQDSADLMTN